MKCRYCEAEIRFAFTGSQKSVVDPSAQPSRPIPVNLDPVEAAMSFRKGIGKKRIVLVAETGEVISGYLPDSGEEATIVKGYRPHWADCPGAEQARKPRRAT